jgi:hypothetical protein
MRNGEEEQIIDRLPADRKRKAGIVGLGIITKGAQPRCVLFLKNCGNFFGTQLIRMQRYWSPFGPPSGNFFRKDRF